MQSLKGSNKVIGIKQSRKALKEKRVEHAYIASDAQAHVTAPILELCKQVEVAYTMVQSMAELGAACGIDVGAAVVVVLKEV